MTHHYCMEVRNLQLSSALKLTFVQFQACSVLNEAGTAWIYVFVGAIRDQARQSIDASIMPRIKPLAMSFHHPAPLSHCGGRLPENPPGFNGTSSSSWAMNHPITRVEFLEMTWNDRPKEVLRTCHGGFSRQRAEGETTSTKKMCRHAACMDFLRIGIARIVEETAFCKCVSDAKWISSILYLYIHTEVMIHVDTQCVEYSWTRKNIVTSQKSSPPSSLDRLHPYWFQHWTFDLSSQVLW